MKYECNFVQFLNYRVIQDWWKFWRKSTVENFSSRWTPWRKWSPPSELTRPCTPPSRLWSTLAMRLVTNEQTKQTHVKQWTKDNTLKKQASLKTNEQTKKQTASKQTNKTYALIVIIDLCMNNVYFCSLGNPFRAVLRALQGCGGTSGGNGALCSLNSSK